MLKRDLLDSELAELQISFCYKLIHTDLLNLYIEWKFKRLENSLNANSIPTNVVHMEFSGNEYFWCHTPLFSLL